MAKVNFGMKMQEPSFINFDDIMNFDDTKLQSTDDHRGFNVLMLASEAGHLKAVEYLIANGEEVNFEVSGETPASLAFACGHYEIVLTLLKANSFFPHNYNEKFDCDELKEFVELSADMHDKVKMGNEAKIENVKIFLAENIKKNSSLCHFYDTENNSLLKTSILSKMFAIYEFLLTLNIFLAPHECMDDLVDCLTSEERNLLSEINLRLSPELLTEPMMILMRNCKLGPDMVEEKYIEYMYFIRRAFDFLFRIPSLAIILKIVAASRKFKIIFDFKRDSVTFLDPRSEPYSNGRFYLSGKIYIAAKDLLDLESAVSVASVIAHELCHFAMFLVYQNEAKPYKVKNKKSKEIFEKIYFDCFRHKKCEVIVDKVYELYDYESGHAELIVTACQMLALYHHEQEILCESKEKFKSLFEFYEERVFEEFKIELPKIEKKFHPSRRTEKKVKMQRKLIIFLVVLIGLAIIFGVYGIFQLLSATILWSNLNSSQMDLIKNSTVNFHDVEVKFGELFADDSKIFDGLSSKVINEVLNGDTFKLSEAIGNYFEPYIFLTYHNMTENLRKKVQNSKITFQGQNLTFNKILTNFLILKFLSTSQIREILKGNIFDISSDFKHHTNFFMERFFIDEEIEVSRKHYANNRIDIEQEIIKNFDEIVPEVKKKKVFLLSSLAGEGKSTTFRHFEKKLKEKFTNKWIQFVDLKKHFDAYKIGENLDYKNIEKVAKFIGEKILNLKNFDLKVFTEIFTQGEVIFLWDGVDEISPFYKDFMLNLTLAIKSSSKNLQFISTRPLHSKDFQKTLKVKAYKLIPLGEDEIYEFLVKFLAAKKFNLDVDEAWIVFRENSSENYETFKSYFDSKTFNEIFSRLKSARRLLDLLNTPESETVANPLLIEIIVEVVEEKINVNLNLYELYKTFVLKKLEIVHKKGEIVHKNFDPIALGSFGFTQIHQAYAIKLIFGSQTNLNISSLEIMKALEAEATKEISRLGILQVVSKDDFNFVHRTFAEFFIAQFFIDNFNNSEITKDFLKFQLFNSIMLKDSFAFTKKLMLNFVKNETSSSKIFGLLYELNLKVEEIRNLTKNEMISKFFFVSGYSYHLEKIYKIFYNESKANLTPLLDEILENWESFEEILGSEIFKFSLFYQDENGRNLLHHFAGYKEENEAKFTQVESFNSENSHPPNFENLPQQTLGNILPDFANFPPSDFGHFQKGLPPNFDHQNIPGNLDQFSQDDFRDPGKFIKILSKLNSTLSNNEIDEILNIQEKNNGKNSYMIAAQVQSSNDLKIAEIIIDFHFDSVKWKKLMNTETFENLTALYFSLFNNDKNSFLIISKMYEKYFKSSELQEIIQKTFENGLHEVALKPSKDELANFLTKNYENIQELLAVRDDNGDTIFGKYQGRFELRTFIMILRKTFDDEEKFKLFLKALTEKSQTLKSIEKMRQNFAANHQFEMFPFLIETAKNVHSKSERNVFRNLLMSKSNDNGTLLHALYFQNNNQIRVVPFLDILKQFLDEKEIIQLLFARNLPLATPIILSAWFTPVKTLMHFWNFIEDFLSVEEQKKLLLLSDRFDGTSIHQAMANDDPKSLIFIEGLYEKYFSTEVIQNLLEKQSPTFPYFIRIIKEASLETVKEDKKYLTKIFKDDKLKLRQLLSFRKGNGDTFFSFFKNKIDAQSKLKVFKELLRETFDENEDKEFEEFFAILEVIKG